MGCSLELIFGTSLKQESRDSKSVGYQWLTTEIVAPIAQHMSEVVLLTKPEEDILEGAAGTLEYRAEK